MLAISTKILLRNYRQETVMLLVFSGADGDAILAHKRDKSSLMGLWVSDYGDVGDIDNVNISLLNCLLKTKSCPVFAPITHDKDGQLLNTNADTIAQEMAKALSKFYDVNLIYSFEKAGVLLDIDDENSVIKRLSWDYYQPTEITVRNGASKFLQA